MNYEQARQVGPDGPAPGKWNWTNFNDGVADHPYTVEPCREPEPGKERCDHDTQEEAERHHWKHEVLHIRLVKLDLETLRERFRCDVEGCPNWEEYQAHWPGGYVVDHLCEEHYDGALTLHPFTPGMRLIHS